MNNEQANIDESIQEGHSDNVNLNEKASNQNGQADSKDQKIEKSIEERISDFEKEDQQKAPEQLDLLSQLNQLGIIRKGLPVEFDDIDKFKSIVSQGFDYYAKTEELANQRKQFEADQQSKMQEIETTRNEIEQFKTQYQDKLIENDVMAQVLLSIQQQDPDTFDLIANQFRQQMQAINYQKNNPAIAGLNNELNQLKKSLAEKENQEKESKYKNINQEWEKGLAEAQSKRARFLQKVGIKPNWQNVQKEWSADPSQSKTVEQVLLQVYAADIAKYLDAQETKTKTLKQSTARQGSNREASFINNKEMPTSRQKLEEIASRYNF